MASVQTSKASAASETPDVVTGNGKPEKYNLRSKNNMEATKKRVHVQLQRAIRSYGVWVCEQGTLCAAHCRGERGSREGKGRNVQRESRRELSDP